MRVEWWLIRLFDAHASRQIDDAKLARSVEAIVGYVEGVTDAMGSETRAFGAHHVEPIPGVDFGDGHFGDTAPK